MTISTPLDSFKAAVLTSNSQIDYVTDRLGDMGIDEELLEALDWVKRNLIEKLGEHVPLKDHPVMPGLGKQLTDAAYVYDDGSPVVEFFETYGLQSPYFPRYDGDREAAYKQHLEHAEQNLRDTIQYEDKIDTLSETDIKSLDDAITKQDMDLVRMKDGSKPTSRQMSFILGAGKDDFLEVQNRLEQRALKLQNSAWAGERAYDLMQKYNPKPGEVLGEVAERMTPEDREEVESLGRMLAEEALD